MASEPKQKILKDGSVRWWCTVSLGQHSDGRRRQGTVTARSKTACLTQAARVEAEAFAGELARPGAYRVPEMIDAFIAYATYGKPASGAPLSYPLVLKPAREFFAQVTVKSVRREDVERFRDWALASGRYGARQPRTVNEMLYLLGAAFDLAVRDAKISRNPCTWVKRVPVPPASRTTWTADQVRAFIKVAEGDRLAACWLISLLGLRRSEVLGLRWEDIEDGTLYVRHARVQAAKGTITKGPKSERGLRPLPLPGMVTSALRDLKRTQAEERLAAGNRYTASGLVAVDRLGRPVRPGHTIEVNRGVYTHASEADMSQVSEALGQVLGG